MPAVGSQTVSVSPYRWIELFIADTANAVCGWDTPIPWLNTGTPTTFAATKPATMYGSYTIALGPPVSRHPDDRVNSAFAHSAEEKPGDRRAACSSWTVERHRCQCATTFQRATTLP